MAADPQAAPSRGPDQSAVVSKTPSRPPPAPVHPLVQAIDQCSDIAGVIGLTVFAISRSMDATLFCVTLCAILGVQTGLRKGLAARGGVGLGAAGLALLGLAHAVHTAAAGGGSPGYLRLPGWYRRGLRGVQHLAVGARALWSLARLRWLAVLVAALALALASPLAGCSGEQRVAQTTIVAVGGSVAAIHEAHRDAYVEATDALRSEIRAQHGSLADYDREVQPIDRAFHARSEALQSLSASLYAAAAIVDAHERGAPASQYAPAAVDVLHALRRVLDVLDHGEVMPRVPIPAEVRTTMRALEAVALAGGALLSPADAGTDGGAE